MPNGYTSTLASGEQSVADYIKHCGRGMGFMVMMRDDPWDAELPEKWEASERHDKRIAELQERKDFLNSLSEQSLIKACTDFYAEEEASRARMIEQNQAQRERYEAMLESVREWKPAHPVMWSTREFAIEQLEKSIDWDCNYTPKPIDHLDPQEWQQAEFDEVMRKLQYHHEERAKERSRTDERNAILAVFKEELAKLETQPHD